MRKSRPPPNPGLKFSPSKDALDSPSTGHGVGKSQSCEVEGARGCKIESEFEMVTGREVRRRLVEASVMGLGGCEVWDESDL